MEKVYVVMYEYVAYEKGEKYASSNDILGVFDTYLRGLSFLRKFYNGEDGDMNEYYGVSLTQTERKNGNDSAKAVRQLTQGDICQTETLRLFQMKINGTFNPFEAIRDTY